KIIQLNVGGAIFHCYLFTLLKYDSLLRILFSNQIENVSTLNDENGMIFLDRPAKPFEIILNCIRANKMEICHNTDLGYPLELFKKELTFYGLEKDIKFVKFEKDKES